LPRKKPRERTELSWARKTGESPFNLDVKIGPQTHFGAKSQSEETIQQVPKPQNMVIIIARRRRGTWEGVPMANWCIRIGGELDPRSHS